MNSSISENIKKELNKYTNEQISKNVENLEDALKLCFVKGIWIGVDCLYQPEVDRRAPRRFIASVYHKENTKITMNFHSTSHMAYNEAFEYVLGLAKHW
jgi:hypothetical protein